MVSGILLTDLHDRVRANLIFTHDTHACDVRVRIQSRIKNPTRWLLVRQSHRLKPSSTYQTPSPSTVVNPFSLAKHNREIGKLNR